MNLLIKIFAAKSINQSASILNIESTLARAKLLADGSNNEPNNAIQLRNFHAHQMTKEIGTSVAAERNHLFDHYYTRMHNIIIINIVHSLHSGAPEARMTVQTRSRTALCLQREKGRPKGSWPLTTRTTTLGGRGVVADPASFVTHKLYFLGGSLVRSRCLGARVGRRGHCREPVSNSTGWIHRAVSPQLSGVALHRVTNQHTVSVHRGCRPGQILPSD